MSKLGLNGAVRQFTRGVGQAGTSTVMPSVATCAAAEVPTENDRAAFNFEAPG